MSYLPVLLFGIYMSWIYLRYFQKRLETGLKGDPSEEFSFSSFFPEFLRPILDPIASIFHRLLCGRSERADARGQTLDTSPLPGSDSIEANRRRLAFVALSSILSVHTFYHSLSLSLVFISV